MYNIIVIDDEDITRMAVSGYIQKTHSNYHVVGTFSNGEDALHFMSHNSVDAVITDIRMPQLDGLELCKHIRNTHSNVGIIIISSYSEFEYAKQSIKYNVSNYLLKPLDFDELSQALNQLAREFDKTHVKVNYQEEDIEVFFTELLYGSLNNSAEIHQRFDLLHMDAPFEAYSGRILSVTLDSDTILCWKYERENLSTALLNGFRMILSNHNIYHLFRTGGQYYFIILSTQGIPAFSVDALRDMLVHLLHFRCNIQEHISFDSIENIVVPHSSILNTKQSFPKFLSNTSVTNKEAVIQKALDYIHTHYAEDLNREDLADIVFLSPSYFSKLFKQVTNMSFTDYLITVRMEEAIKLLSTQTKIGDIGIKVGYQSRNRFFINFRQYTGYSPTEYRRKILHKGDIANEE